VSNLLAGERGDLAATLKQLSLALGEVAAFVRDNRAVLTSNVDRLTEVTAVLVRQRAALADILDTAPTGLSNAYNASNATSGTLDTRLNLEELRSPPILLVCELLRRATPRPVPATLADTCRALEPQLTGAAPLPPVAEVITAVLAGLNAAPIQAVAIVCAMRHHTPQDNIELAHEAGLFAGRGVVGFDLAGDEVRYPASPQRPAFEAARAAGLRLTCHSGEAGNPSNVEEALSLGVERIAHGVTGAREPMIVERIRSEGVVLDLCPTANWKCKAVPNLQDHPLPKLVRAGVRCTISTDSRTVAGTTLTNEFAPAPPMGMTDDAIPPCNATAYPAHFV